MHVAVRVDEAREQRNIPEVVHLGGLIDVCRQLAARHDRRDPLTFSDYGVVRQPAIDRRVSHSRGQEHPAVLVVRQLCTILSALPG